MIRLSPTLPLAIAATLVAAGTLLAQLRTGPRPVADQSPAVMLARQGAELTREGKYGEAVERYRQALKLSPNLFEAHSGLGMTLDLLGEYKPARAELAKAIETAPGASRPQALRTMAVSYAFTCQTVESGRYEREAFDAQIAAKDFYAAGETADELARIYLECGHPRDAGKWYRTGHDTGLRQPDITGAQKDLWDFRLHHALARIAARDGRPADAAREVAAAKAILDKGDTWQKQQEPFFPYLTGYVAFYAGDYRAALADLEKANQRDPFILRLMAQNYAKLGDTTQAMRYYRLVLDSNAHNPPTAFSRPLAKKMLGAASPGG